MQKVSDEAKRTSEATRFEYLTLEGPKQPIVVDESFGLKLRFGVRGGFYDAFHQGTWEHAYESHDIHARLTFEIQVGTWRARGLRRRPLIHVPRVVRKATFYWSRDPTNPHRIWVLIVDEGEPVLPHSEGEARQRFFDFQRSFQVMGAQLGAGAHRLRAIVKGRWGRHSYVEKGTVSSYSDACIVHIR